MYSSISYDEVSRQVHLYGATTADYSTGYYYGIYVGLNLILDSGQQVCTANEGWEYYSSLVERSCDYTVPSGVTELDYVTTHYLTATYYYYQLAYCPYGCTGWGDMYGFSLTSTGSGLNLDNTVVFAPGQLVEIQYDTAKAGNILRKTSTGCSVPTGETSEHEGWGSAAYSEEYAALFKGKLQGAGYFDLRFVVEALYWAFPHTSIVPYPHSDGCYFSGSPYLPVIPQAGHWPVGIIQGPGIYYVEPRSYGYDAIGLHRPRLLFYRNNLINTNKASCDVRYVQQMSYSCFIGTFNDMRWYKNNAMTITLQQYSVTNQRDNASAYQFIP